MGPPFGTPPFGPPSPLLWGHTHSGFGIHSTSGGVGVVVVMVVVGSDSLDHPAPDHLSRTTLRRTAQNFVFFFPPAPIPFFFSLSLGVFSLIGPPGFHTTAREPKRAHFRARALTPPIPRKDSRERKEIMEIVAGEGKKRANFWAVWLSGERRGPGDGRVLGGGGGGGGGERRGPGGGWGSGEGGPVECGPGEGGVGGRSWGGRFFFF